MHIDIPTAPKTAPRHTPTLAARYRALESLRQHHVRAWGNEFEPEDVAGGGLVFVIATSPSRTDTQGFITRCNTPTANSFTTAATAGVNLWNEMSIGLLVSPVYPASVRRDTKLSKPSEDHVREEQRLDAAFAALVMSENDVEDLSLEETRSNLKYRFPR